MKKIFQFKRMMLWILIPISFLLVLFARLNNVWVEKLFVPYIYKPLSWVVGGLVSLFPFSVTELIVILLLAGAVLYLVLFVRSVIKEKNCRRHLIYKLFVNIICILSVALFLFQMTMGLNYYRVEITQYLDIDVKKRDVSELYSLCEMLVEDMNTYRNQLKKDENGITRLSDDNRFETSNSAKDAYKALSEKIPVLKTADIRNKPLISSKLFSAVLTTGIYIPYTFESNINIDVPEFTIPATMCHELTHFRGFMRENEANFLSYLACMESDRADFKYSGSFMAFGYCYTALYKADKDLAKQIAALCDDGIIDDVQFEDNYWAPYRSTVTAQVSNTVYNTYLEVNDQKSGIRSYGEMVDLMLAWFDNN